MVGQKFSKCIECGFCFPSFRKEVGLDLFFPKQMQENLKVREAEIKEPRDPCLMCVLVQELENPEKRIYCLRLPHIRQQMHVIGPPGLGIRMRYTWLTTAFEV